MARNAPEWAMRGTMIVACNCDFGCPCNVNGRPSTGKCEGGWTWRIDYGHYGDAALDGLSLSVYANWPAAIHEGGGVAVAFLDERADDAQRNALTTLLRGEAGGPWGIFITTYDLAEPRPMPYDIEIAEGSSRFTIGDVVELQMQTITNPVTGNEVHPRLSLPEGLVVRDMGLYASKTFRVCDGIDYDHSGRYAGLGPFDYAGP